MTVDVEKLHEAELLLQKDLKKAEKLIKELDDEFEKSHNLKSY